MRPYREMTQKSSHRNRNNPGYPVYCSSFIPIILSQCESRGRQNDDRISVKLNCVMKLSNIMMHIQSIHKSFLILKYF